MGYYFENEPQNIHNTKKILFIYYSHSDPMGTDGQTDKRTNIYSLFRDKLSHPEGSSDLNTKAFNLLSYRQTLGTILVGH